MEGFIVVVELTTRAVHSHLVSCSGKILYSSMRALESAAASPDEIYIVDLDPATLWSTICGCVADCVKRANGVEILCMSTSSQRLTTAIVDNDGKTAALCPNVDARGVEVDDIFTESMGERAYEITGLHPAFFFGASRLRWFKSFRPQVFEKIKYVMTIDGWLYYKFTGSPAEEPSQAAGSYLFDISRRTWCEEICNIVGIQRAQLPKIVEYGDLVGYPTEEFQALTGITARTPVVMGAGDTQCSGIGSSALSAGQAYASLGSTAPLQVIMSEPLVDPNKRMWTGCFPIDDQWVLESNSGICGTVFDWLASSVLRLKRGDNIDYEQFDQLAKSAPSGSWDVCAFLGPSIMDARAFTNVVPALIILPSLMVGRKPGASEIARACYEDIAYACRGNFEQMQEVWRTVEPTFRVAGNLAKSEVLVQILADVLARKVVTPTERRASAIGSAIAGISFLQSKKPRDVVSELVELRSTAPSKASEAYSSSYSRWRRLYDKLGDLT